MSGDMMAAIAIVDGTATGLARPAGWTNLANGTTPFDAQFDYDISYISRGGSAPSLTWTWTGNVYYEVHILCVHTDDAGTVTLDANAAILASGSNSALDGSAVTVVGANSLAAVLFAEWSGSGSGGWTAPTNYTIRSTNTAGLDGGIIARTALVGAGSEDPGAVTNSTGNSNSVSMTMSFNETGGGGGGGGATPGSLTLMWVGK